MTRDHIGPEEFEHLADAAVDSLYPGADHDAMAMSFNLMRVTNRLLRDLEGHVHRPGGMSFAAYRLLFSIKAVGVISPNQLARLSNVSTASMSSLLKTLDGHGLITREDDPVDGRRSLIGLSEKGESTFAALLRDTNRREQLWAAGLTPIERDLLISLLRKLLLHHPAEDHAAEDRPAEA